MGANQSTEGDFAIQPITIISPFQNNITIFDNDDDFLFPDSELSFEIPGLKKPIHLHYSVLRETSFTLSAMVNSQDNTYGVFDEKSDRLVWTCERTAGDALYRNALVKWLRFCYGEDQVFHPQEISTALVALHHLGLKPEKELIEEIEAYMVHIPMEDLFAGVKLMYQCVAEFDNNKELWIIKVIERMKEIVREEVGKNEIYLFNVMPELKTQIDVVWEKDVRGKEFEAFLSLLMENVVPTKTLNLSMKNIGDDGMKKICLSLRHNTTLTVLNVSNNNIGREGVTDLFEALKNNKSLTSMDISNNRIDVEGANIVSKLLMVNSSLTSLRLENNNLGTYGVRSIWDALQVNTTMKKLNGKDDETFNRFLKLNDRENEMFPELRRTRECTLSSICSQRSVFGRLGLFQRTEEANTREMLYLQSMWSITNSMKPKSEELLQKIKEIGKLCWENKGETDEVLVPFSLIDDEDRVSSESMMKLIALMANLLFLSKGNSVFRDALKILETNAEHGDINSLSCLGVMYEFGLNGVIRQEERSKQFYDKFKEVLELRRNIILDKEINDEPYWNKQFGFFHRLGFNTIFNFCDLDCGFCESEKNRCLLGALAKNTTLRKLRISCFKCEIEDTRLFLKSLLTNNALTSLEVSGISGFGQKIGELLKTNTVLTTLNLAGNALGAHGAIGESLEVNNTLTNLNLSYNTIGDNGVIALFKSLKKNNTLAKLDLSHNQIGVDGARMIGETLTVNSSLTKLDLTCNTIGTSGARAICESLLKNRAMKELSLWNNRIGVAGATKMGDVLKANNGLSSLHLGANRIGLIGIKSIADALLRNTSLTQLNLYDNVETSFAIEPLSTVFKTNSSLKSLAISHQGQQEHVYLSKLCESLMDNTALSSLFITSERVIYLGRICELLDKNTTLTELNLSSNMIDGWSVKRLCESLKTNSSLTKLSLSGNKLHYNGALALGTSLKCNSTLTILDLSSNSDKGYGTKGMPCSLLCSNKTLTRLDLALNELNDEDAKEISESLMTNTTLTSLNLNENVIGRLGAIRIGEALMTNTTLTELSLLINPIQKEGAESIRKAWGIRSGKVKVNFSFGFYEIRK